jgi:hypothetical protein
MIPLWKNVQLLAAGFLSKGRVAETRPFFAFKQA